MQDAVMNGRLAATSSRIAISCYCIGTNSSFVGQGGMHGHGHLLVILPLYAITLGTGNKGGGRNRDKFLWCLSL